MAPFNNHGRPGNRRPAAFEPHDRRQRKGAFIEVGSPAYNDMMQDLW
jgi:hypothetical protein